ncbi:MAG: hypothetical protein J5867_04905 [Prevotella sp.]|nr:hypothetical protein [Prevotella sp.]
METVEDGIVLTPIQQRILTTFSHIKSDEELNDVRKIISDYYFEQVEKEMAELEAKGQWSKEKCEEIAKEHLRTPYIY